ncbi:MULTISPECIES: CPBP family glutamic-type intramembrane protease [Aphanothece]|uniref:CPBP family glutamic-type intramembrane protease n=1 Tax=Aphanothece TaxID=1121 RepID=UPI003984C15B
MPPAGRARPVARPHWWGTAAYVPLLYALGFALSRPLGWLRPEWRADQVDLAGVAIAFGLLLATLPWRIRRAWGSRTPWQSLGLAAPPGSALVQVLGGLLQAVVLLGLTASALLLGAQAQWSGRLAPDLVANALLLGLGVGLAEEVLFRGWLWGELNLQIGRRRALVLQAAIFALVHPWYRAPGLQGIVLLGGLLLLGLALGLRKLADGGALWGAVALHGGLVGGWFLVQKGLLTIAPAAPAWWAGAGSAGDVNPIGGLVGWLGLLVLLWWLRRQT